MGKFEKILKTFSSNTYKGDLIIYIYYAQHFSFQSFKYQDYCIAFYYGLKLKVHSNIVIQKICF